MVSFWPFRSGDPSASEFEKILSNLSTKINKATAKETRLRSQQRRFRVLWTLYTSFAYLAALLLLFLVVGRAAWTASEYFGLIAGPFLIYAGRLLIDTVSNYRLSGAKTRLDALQAERTEAIEKLKAATKYNSTQQLLDKYGGSDSKPSTPTPKGAKPRRSTTGSSPQQQRTGLPPPPTANIPRPQPASPPSSPPTSSPKQQQQLSPPSPTAEFAPNAFTAAPPPPGGPPQEPKWYDRLLDAILGEDETSPRNRLALLCSQCRLVNGLAPPGARTLEDVGRWKCMSCHATNGVAGVAERAVADVVRDAQSRKGDVPDTPRSVDEEKPESKGGKVVEDGEDGEDEEDDDVEMVDVPEETEMKEAKSSGRETKSPARQRRK